MIFVTVLLIALAPVLLWLAYVAVVWFWVSFVLCPFAWVWGRLFGRRWNNDPAAQIEAGNGLGMARNKRNRGDSKS